MPDRVREALQQLQARIDSTAKQPAYVAEVDQKAAEAARLAAEQVHAFVHTEIAAREHGVESDERRAYFFSRAVAFRSMDRDMLILMANYLVEMAAAGLEYAWGGWDEILTALADPDLPLFPEREKSNEPT